MEVLAHFVGDSNAFKKRRRNMVCEYEDADDRRSVAVRRNRFRKKTDPSGRDACGVEWTRWFSVFYADAASDFDAASFKDLLQRISRSFFGIGHCKIKLDRGVTGWNRSAQQDKILS